MAIDSKVALYLKYAREIKTFSYFMPEQARRWKATLNELVAQGKLESWYAENLKRDIDAKTILEERPFAFAPGAFVGKKDVNWLLIGALVLGAVVVLPAITRRLK